MTAVLYVLFDLFGFFPHSNSGANPGDFRLCKRCKPHCLSKAVNHKVSGCWRGFERSTAALIRRLAAARRVKFLRFIPVFLVPSQKVSPPSSRSVFIEPFRASGQNYDREDGGKVNESFFGLLLPLALPIRRRSPCRAWAARAARRSIHELEASLQQLLATTVGATDLPSRSLPGLCPPHLRLRRTVFP